VVRTPGIADCVGWIYLLLLVLRSAFCCSFCACRRRRRRRRRRLLLLCRIRTCIVAIIIIIIIAINIYSIVVLCFFFRPEQFVWIGFSSSQLAPLPCQSLTTSLFVKGAGYHLNVRLRVRVDFRGHITALAGTKGQGFPVPKVDGCSANGPALEGHRGSGRFQVVASPVEVSSSAFCGIAADESPRNNRCNNASGDSVSLAGQNTAVLLERRAGCPGAMCVAGCSW